MTPSTIPPGLPTPRPSAARRLACCVLGLIVFAGAAQAAQFTINGPVGSGQFGRTVTILPNGNFVVTDPGFDAPGPIADVGAAYLYRPNGTLISTLRGSSPSDRVGAGGAVALPSGHFLVISPLWDNGAAGNAGAVTFGSGTSGIAGVVSAANSLVGSAASDAVGGSGVTVLTNGNYVVRSPTWDNGATADAGAVTFGSGTSGISGVISPANSLVGSTASDAVGGGGVTRLANGHYVVVSADWDNGAIVDAGAVTFGSGTAGISGVVSPANSLVGSTASDRVGATGVTALSNGSYVVVSSAWDNGTATDAGAVTFGSAAGGISGVVSPANSLVGSTANDRVGTTNVTENGVTALTNGHYVVASPLWDLGTIVNAGAATFGSGTSGISGVVSPANSLVGSTAFDSVGSSGVTALTNGNFVVSSPSWNNGAINNAGAVTFGSGTSGTSGMVVSPANSLVGSTAGDGVGTFGVIALPNGNYVVRSPNWDNGAVVNAGAATFGSGISGISGVLSAANSLVGSTANDSLGSLSSVTRLANGNYVVASPSWDNGATANAGAVTFGSGTSGISGVVSPVNSLVGSTANDQVGGGGVTPLNNGNYVVRSPLWDNGANANVGAVTFGLGTTGITGVVLPVNSLVGTTASDAVGSSGVSALFSGNYVVRSADWDNGAIANAGAVTFGSGTSGIAGAVSPANSLVGSTANDQVGGGSMTPLTNGNYVVETPVWDNGAIVDAGAITLGLFDGSVVGAIAATHGVLGSVTSPPGVAQTFAYDPLRNQLVVGQPASNRVVLQRTGIATAISIVGDTPDPSLGGQPVTFTATVSASPNAPSDGQVTFTASSGERCVDTTPTSTSATTANYACTITFTANGTATVVAEYTGSIIHAFSGSGPETHTTILDPVFSNGFESP